MVLSLPRMGERPMMTEARADLTCWLASDTSSWEGEGSGKPRAEWLRRLRLLWRLRLGLLLCSLPELAWCRGRTAGPHVSSLPGDQRPCSQHPRPHPSDEETQGPLLAREALSPLRSAQSLHAGLLTAPNPSLPGPRSLGARFAPGCPQSLTSTLPPRRLRSALVPPSTPSPRYLDAGQDLSHDDILPTVG